LDSLFLLIPLSIVLIGLVAVLFLWAVRSGQFDDLEGPAHDILNDDEVASNDPNVKSNDENTTNPRLKD